MCYKTDKNSGSAKLTYFSYAEQKLPCLVRYIEAIYIYSDKSHRSISFEIPERVLLTGAISICKKFSKASHRCRVKMCDQSLLAIFTF